MLLIYVDADACPVKDEVYKVARRYGMPVKVVVNAQMKVPDDPLIELLVHLASAGWMTGSLSRLAQGTSSSPPTSHLLPAA